MHCLWLLFCHSDRDKHMQQQPCAGQDMPTPAQEQPYSIDLYATWDALYTTQYSSQPLPRVATEHFKYG